MSSMKIQCPPQTYSRLFRPWDMAQRNAAANNSQSLSASKAHAAGERAVTAAIPNKHAAPENLIIRADKVSRSINPKTNTIKVEIVKVERHDGMETEDEDVEVDDDDGRGDDDDCDYLHTSRNSDCASSQSNFSQLSDETERQQYEDRERSTSENRFIESKSAMHRLAHANNYTAQQTHETSLSAHHHFTSRTAFETYHQHHMHLLSNVMSTPPPTTVPTSTPPTTAVPTMPAHLTSEFIYGSAGAAALGRSSDIVPTAPHPTSLMGMSATAASFVGMDAYTFGLMEQEYARIMAEEAHLKAVNARKQRPKKFKCPHCNVAFSNNGQLKGHIRIHTGERPFKCDVETCGKTFTRNEELTRHKRIHTGLRPYPCPACGKKFGRRDHLKKHMKTHMPQERQLGPAIFVPMYPYLYGY
ncbi:uncharacterized protein hkb [Eurosta solidaginis]|uniref:uncharacterized protein hkb n=1 Tax=Eurosta solidaginis TaxID=178769 RepID=UPI0035314EA4